MRAFRGPVGLKRVPSGWYMLLRKRSFEQQGGRTAILIFSESKKVIDDTIAAKRQDIFTTILAAPKKRHQCCLPLSIQDPETFPPLSANPTSVPVSASDHCATFYAKIRIMLESVALENMKNWQELLQYRKRKKRTHSLGQRDLYQRWNFSHSGSSSPLTLVHAWNSR